MALKIFQNILIFFLLNIELFNLQLDSPSSITIVILVSNDLFEIYNTPNYTFQTGDHQSCDLPHLAA